MTKKTHYKNMQNKRKKDHFADKFTPAPRNFNPYKPPCLHCEKLLNLNDLQDIAPDYPTKSMIFTYRCCTCGTISIITIPDDYQSRPQNYPYTVSKLNIRKKDA